MSAAAATVTVEIPFLPWTGKARLGIEVGAEIEKGLRLRAALEIAGRGRASLIGANLDRARLDGACLDGARLDDARLSRASLIGASLIGASLNRASLIGARLADARLVGARLAGARLAGARLAGANLAGERPVFIMGPLGRESRYITAYQTDAGIRVRAGCFFGSLDAFRAAVAKTHGRARHGREYAAAITMIEAHCAAWPGKTADASLPTAA